MKELDQTISFKNPLQYETLQLQIRDYFVMAKIVLLPEELNDIDVI